MTDLHRRRIRRTLLSLALTLVVGVGLAWWLTAAPSRAPDYAGPRPEPVEEGAVRVSHSVLIAAPPDVVHAWTNAPDRNLADLVRFESDFPAVAGTQPLIGDWVPGGREGDRRRVTFTDGHHLAEEVINDRPDRFRYVIWGFTGPQRVAVDHGVAEFTYHPEGSGTRVRWTYAMQPTTGLLRPLVQDFMDDTMSPMMTASLAAMREGVEAERR